jgi:integrase
MLLPEAQIRVAGKGNKPRLLPLAPETVQLLDHYLRFERPDTRSAPLLVSLKGRARGARMTPAGLRSLFRYHRRGRACRSTARTALLFMGQPPIDRIHHDGDQDFALVFLQ